MLQSMRDNMKGAVAVFVVALMVIPLVLFGVDRIFLNTTNVQSVAEVNGEDISEIELAREIGLRRQQLQQQFGESLPESFLTDENLRGQALDQLVNRELWLQAAEDGKMLIPSRRIDQILVESDEFKRDGKFSSDLFRFQANNMGYTATAFREQIREDLSVDQLRTSLATNGFTTDKQLEALAAISNQTRDFYYLTIPAEPLRETITVDDAEVQAYYEENQNQFLSPEQISIEYLELSLAAIAVDVEVSEAELLAQYEEEVSDFVSAPEYRVAHILVEPKDDDSHIAALEEIQSKLAAGEEFADLASQYSDDFGSKDSGGDLGFTQGDTFPDEFESALAALVVNTTSESIETDAGFHIIKKLEERSVEPPSFEEEKSRIERFVKESKVEQEFFDLERQLDDLTYSAPDLQEAAQELNLSIQTAGPFPRSGGVGIAASSAVIEAAFGDDVLNEGHNSSAIEVSDNHLVVVRLKEHQPEHVQELADVKDGIVNLLRSQEATVQLHVLGETLQQKILDGESVEDLAKEGEYDWQVSLDTTRSSPQVSREILTSVFAMAPPKEAEILSGGIVDSAGDYVVYHLTEVKDGVFSELTSAEKDSLRLSIRNLEGEGVYGAFQENLRLHASIEIDE